VSEKSNPTIFFHSPVQLPVLAEMMEYLANHLQQIDPDGMVEFFGRKFEHFGAGVVDVKEESDVVGDLNEWQRRHEDPTYDASKVAMSAKLEKYKNAKLLLMPHYSDGKPKPKLIYDYDSEENNETVTLYLMHPDIATKGDHIPEADARAAYREGYAVAKAFGFRVHLPTMMLAAPPRRVKPSILNKYPQPHNWDAQLQVFFAGLIDGAEEDTDDAIHYGMISRTAEKLGSYMQFRAAREGAKSTLDEAFFANAINMGTRTFFGIAVDPGMGQLLEDKQNPAALAAWQVKEKSRTAHPLAAD
jgi:hypothetical protein